MITRDKFQRYIHNSIHSHTQTHLPTLTDSSISGASLTVAPSGLTTRTRPPRSCTWECPSPPPLPPSTLLGRGTSLTPLSLSPWQEPSPSLTLQLRRPSLRAMSSTSPPSPHRPYISTRTHGEGRSHGLRGTSSNKSSRVLVVSWILRFLSAEERCLMRTSGRNRAPSRLCHTPQ